MPMPDAGDQPGSTHLTDTTALLAELLALESAAMDRWGAGDPDGFLELSADDVTYVDPWQSAWVVGLPALRELYDGLRGQVHIDTYEFIEPSVIVAGDLAVLSFRFESTNGGDVTRWNTTEAYRRDAGIWRIVHTHWSLTEAGARLTGGAQG